jgi:hypothetical protein
MFVLVLAALLTLLAGCGQKAPLEARLQAFLTQATEALKANAADPDRAAAAVTALAQANSDLLDELRAFKRDGGTGKELDLPEAAQARLQKAVAELMAAAMNEKLMASPRFQEAMKALFQ